MLTEGRVVSLQTCPAHRKPMQTVDRMETEQNLGIKGDLHALPGSSRHVLLIEQETLRQGLRDELAGRRGMLAHVAGGGTIHIGDSIILL